MIAAVLRLEADRLAAMRPWYPHIADRLTAKADAYRVSAHLTTEEDQ